MKDTSFFYSSHPKFNEASFDMKSSSSNFSKCEVKTFEEMDLSWFLPTYTFIELLAPTRIFLVSVYYS